MTQNSKKLSKSPNRKRKRAYIAPRPNKPTVWGKVAPGLAMLRYRPQFHDLKGSTSSRKIKNSSTCVVAPVYVAVEEFSEWSTAVMENIFEIGNEVHRLTLQQLKLRGNSSYPIQCVCPTFLLNSNRVTILVRPCSSSNPLHGGQSSSFDDTQVQMLDKLLSENHGVVLQCSGKSFAFWRDKSKFYALIPEGFRDVDNRLPALLRTKDLRALLEQSLQLQRGVCSLYSVKVLNKVKIPMTLENINDEFQLPPEDTDVAEDDGGEDTRGEEEVEKANSPATPAPAPTPTKTKKDKKKVEEPEPVGDVFSEDMILTFSSDYKELPDKRGILVGKEYCKEPDRIPHTIIAAAVFLHNFPANLWTSIIIHDIMKFGKKLFFESEDEDLLENEDWTERITFPIKFMKENLSANFDKLVFGRVASTDPDVLSVEQGLMKFFDGNDTGILVGPQMVLVWQQKNNFFMFDPKERDGLGRKWTRMFSSELGSTALAGSACVTWYRNPKKLAEVYVDSIALKHRQDPYRIIKLKFFETPTKADNKGEWIGMAENKWMLVGTKTLCDYSYADDSLRSGKAICMGVSALMTAREKSEEDWESETVDKVLGEGIEMFKLSLSSHGNEKPFGLQSVKTMLDIGGRRARITIIDCKIRGPMLAEAKSSGLVQLKNGLIEFFDSANYGIFTVKGIALAIWRGQDKHFYLFYPYEKLLGMPPQCFCENEKMLPPMGVANAMRFKTIGDIFDFLTTCLNTKDNDEYCLSPVDIGLSVAADRPPLYEYEEFGTSGAIIRPFKDLHEGHEMFGVRADKQTLANLLTALGLNHINSSINWSKEDLTDILKIGDKLFCKIYMGLPECQARDYKLQWEDVVPMIGMNKFTFIREPIVGVLEILPEVMGEEGENEMMGVQEDYENDEGIEAQDDELFVRPRGSIAEEHTPTPANDLRGILQSWDEKTSEHHEAVLESDFYKIALWKRDNLYFVFDPKASGQNGELTERRTEMGKDQLSGDNLSIMAVQQEVTDGAEGEEVPKAPTADRPLYLEKRTYTHFENEGSAYSAWFSNFEEFFDHISAKTPQDFKYGKFTLHDLTLTSMPVGTDDFVSKLKPGYRSLGPNHSILRGSMTQNNPSLMNRNKLAITNCIVAMTFARITPSSKMTTTLLDVLLKYGDRLYTKSLKASKNTNMANSVDKLSLEEISSVFSIYKIRFKWKINSTTNGNLLLNELKKATGKLGTIEGGSAMILSHKGYVMAFWKGDGGGFYLYDPFETNPSGALVEHGGLPSLSKFSKIDNLLSYLLSKFVCIGGSNTFTLFTIGIESAPVEKLNSGSTPPEEDVLRLKLVSHIASDQNMFQPYQTDMRILKSALVSNITPQHGLALAALVHSRLQFVELWNTNISQRITFLARYLLQKTDCEIELLRLPQTTAAALSSSFDDIRCNFVIDNEFLCNVVFTKNIQGPIFTTKRTEIVGVNLRNALIMFFKSCQQVVVFLPGSGDAFAIWEGIGVFYLFGVDRVEREIYVISSSTLVSLCDIILKGTNPEEDLNNWYELRSVNVSVVPLKEGICKPVKVHGDIVEGPLSTKSGNNVTDQSKEAFFFNYVSEKPGSLPLKPKAKEFLQLAGGIEILHSQDTLQSHRFYGTKDFFPSLQAACVEASALARVKSPTLWTKKTLKKILLGGVNLYINTVAVKGSSNIQMVDFKGNFYLSNQKLEVIPYTPIIQPASSKNELLMCLTWILRKYQTAYLYSQNFCFTIILENGDYFLYYPGSNWKFDNLEKLCSCLMRFCTISDLLDRLFLNNKEISMCENLSIGPIYVFENYCQ